MVFGVKRKAVVDVSSVDDTASCGRAREWVPSLWMVGYILEHIAGTSRRMSEEGSKAGTYSVYDIADDGRGDGRGGMRA